MNTEITALSAGKFVMGLIKDILPNKVFPLIAPANTQYPFIIYRRANIQVKTNKDILCKQDTATVEIIIASPDYVETIELSEKVRSKIENAELSIQNTDISNIYLIQASESYLNDAHIQKLTFNITL